MIERIARALCEQHIRNVRRHDTEPERLEAMLPAGVDHAWPDFNDAAKAVLDALSAGDGVQECDREQAAEYVKHGLIDHIMRPTAEAFARHRALAAAAERARIVAWLRSQDSFGPQQPGAIADAIEAGEM